MVTASLEALGDKMKLNQEIKNNLLFFIWALGEIDEKFS